MASAIGTCVLLIASTYASSARCQAATPSCGLRANLVSACTADRQCYGDGVCENGWCSKAPPPKPCQRTTTTGTVLAVSGLVLFAGGWVTSIGTTIDQAPAIEAVFVSLLPILGPAVMVAADHGGTVERWPYGLALGAQVTGITLGVVGLVAFQEEYWRSATPMPMPWVAPGIAGVSLGGRF